MAGQGLKGTVCVIDASPSAPALADADRFSVVPPFASDEYFPAVAELCAAWGVGLAFSVNDFEATLWATDPSSPFSRGGVNLIAPSLVCQSLVEDKAAYRDAFESSGIRTPVTLIGTDAYGLDGLPWEGDVIIKHRFGSGSVGLARVAQHQWHGQLARTAAGAMDRLGRSVSSLEEGLGNVVVQQAIDGAEHGLDVVHDFDGKYVTTLARRKLRMRSGETDQAVTVSAEPFHEIARLLGGITKHRGLIDTDVIVNPAGVPYLIDVNPRFGGGYPFSHVAGAAIPHAYLAWHTGLAVADEWFSYEVGVTSAKTEDIRVARPAPSSLGR
ncbi:hypothetical protein ASG90_01090 [Nocardioides sp. Soil797]|nr:hypothetical protein ASG90_01090 [Nocardioides sp. Soil797]